MGRDTLRQPEDQVLPEAAAIDLSNLIEGYVLCARAEGKSSPARMPRPAARRLFMAVS